MLQFYHSTLKLFGFRSFVQQKEFDFNLVDKFRKNEQKLVGTLKMEDWAI